MSKRFLIIFVTLLIAIVAILFAARNQTGPNTISYADPAGLLIAIGMVVVLFLPPLLLSFFPHFMVRTISAVYQAFIAIAFIGLIPAAIFASAGIAVTIAAIAGTLTSIASIFVTLFAGKSKNTYGF
ncbi:hypothetical protein [Oceanobacillus neutriphilus]|uniref:Uncharacterized protein n=1 Tax=Oceanobacillus neutriphilus TaxID=531815 RepID=A0ABQ2NQW4_9BACI|nr:hypothetical protein [Oceanobacillus neutriphilus]GGP08241.1 hypothetical protein GCM10011346_07500 [Oceanobacillus neutriphilus]